MRRTSLLLAFTVLAAVAQAEPRVLVMASDDDEPSRSVAAGIRQSAADTRVDVQTFPLSRVALEHVVRGTPRDTVLVPLGMRAAQGLLEVNPQHSVVACFLPPNAAGMRQSAAWQTITLEVPADIQAAWIRRVLPSVRKVGVLYNPAESAGSAEALSVALRRAGFTAQLAEASRPAAVDSVLGQLRDRADVLITIPDPAVFNLITAKIIMLFSYRQRVPVIGQAQNWAKAGALFSVEVDLEEHGRHCGQLAIRSLGLATRGAAEPRKLVTSINMRAAAHMRLALQPDLVALFGTVYD